MNSKIFNMKKLIIGLVTCIFGCMSMSGQSEISKLITPIGATMEDYISLLNANGYDAFSFDITSLLDGQYRIYFIVKEYKNGNLIKDNLWPEDKLYAFRKNMSLMSEYPSEMQENIKPEEMADPDRGIYTMAKKITVGFAPSNDESEKQVMVDLENMSSRYGVLSLQPQYQDNDSVNGKKIFSYRAKPFKASELKAGQFIPLVMYGSFWYDKEFNIFRFCGEDEIDPDMSTEILKFIPHFYIIGIEIEPVKMLND